MSLLFNMIELFLYKISNTLTFFSKENTATPTSTISGVTVIPLLSKSHPPSRPVP